jgi:dipeptidyl aminopeptidase/acylaminoacyl peptidase
MQPKKWLWRGVITVIILAVFCLGISVFVGWSLTHPNRLPLTESPQAYNLQFAEVDFVSRGDGVKLKGWLLPAKNSNHTLIFAHGYGKNRQQVDVPELELAKELVTQGYNVLLFDFRNSGTSGGEITSVGQYEVCDLLGAIDYIKAQDRIGQHVALLGFSMGASAISSKPHQGDREN